MKLTGTGVVGDSTLEGSEETMTFYNYAQKINLISNAVVSAGKMTNRMSMFDLKTQFKDGLADWLQEKLEKNIIYALSGLASADGTVALNSPSTNRVWKGGQTAAGTVEDVGATDAAVDSTTNNLFGPEVISVVKRKAQMASPKIAMAKVNGQSLYAMVIHPYQAKSLTASTNWQNAQYYAADRGNKNIIFQGGDYLGTYDGVAIYVHDGIITKVGGGSGAAGYFESGDVVSSTYTLARALFLGAQAAVIGYGQYPGWYEKDFDYGRVPGVATDVIVGIGKTEFNSEDFGVIAVDTMAVPDA
jgi:N4-gp56 family major capsid protein